MKKNIISILTLASLLTLFSCGNEVPLNSDPTSSNNSLTTSNNSSNNSTSKGQDIPSDDPVSPEIDSDEFDVIYDNNTTTLDKITVIDKKNAGKDVSLTINGTKTRVGNLSSDGKLELTWTVAPLDKNTITFSVDGTENSKTIKKLTPTMMNALQRSYGFQNAFASTYDELLLQTIYCAENGTNYKSGNDLLIGDKSNNIASFMDFSNVSVICYSPYIINTSILSTVGANGNTINAQFGQALMKELNIGVSYSAELTDLNPSWFDSDTHLLQVNPELKQRKDTDETPSTITTNLPSFAGYKPYYGTGVSSLPIDSYPTVNHVNTGFALFYYTSLGYRPICEANSSADKVYNNARNVLMNILDDSMNEFQKVLAIHDWVTFRATYNNQDINNGYNQFIDGLLKDENYNLTVCNGFALTFNTLCSMAGIEAKYITGYAGENHAWNEVKVNGKWYCVDSTWDKSFMNSWQVENHQHFLVSWDKLSELTTGGRRKTATYSYPTASLATNGNYPYYQTQTYSYNNQNYSRYISSDLDVTNAINYLKNKASNFNSQQTCKATLSGYTLTTSNHAIEEFGFKNADIFNSFKSKLSGISYSASNNYDSFSVYINLR